jgi:hypothetical protein
VVGASALGMDAGHRAPDEVDRPGHERVGEVEGEVGEHGQHQGPGSHAAIIGEAGGGVDGQ